MRRWLICIVSISWSIAFGQTTHVTYTPTDDIFPNPERGMYIGYDRKSEDQPLSLSALRALATQNVTLINPTYYLDAFLNSDLSSTELALLQTDFDNMRKAGLKAVLRFAYTHSMNDPTAPDASLDIILRHLDQLAPVLQQNADVIAVLQAGFVGAWGEWHSSTNGLDTNTAARAAIVAKELSILPTERMIQLRYVRHKMAIFGQTPMTADEAYSGSNLSRIGFHDDALLTDWSGAGMYYLKGNYSDTNVTRPYLQAESQYVPIGGEAYSSNQIGNLITCSNILGEMSRNHWSYFHRDWEPTIIAYLQANGCFDDIDRYLGYRFSLVSGDFTGSVQPGGSFHLSLQIQNLGWASLYNPRPVEILLRNLSDGTLYVVTLPDDPRRWAPGTTSTLDATVGVPSSMPSGSYEVLLNLPDSYPSIHDRPEYAVRLADANTWDPSTGYNDLQTSISIDPNASGQQYTGTLVFQSKSGLPVTTSDIPSLISPPANSLNVPTTTTLRWHAGAHATSYLVQVSDDAAFGTYFLNDSIVTDTARQITGLGENRIYFWRVKSQGPTGQNGFSSSWSFTTAGRPAPTGSFTASPQSLPVGGGQVTLTWSSANADSAVISPGVGSVGPQGSTSVTVTQSTTFTITLIGASRQTLSAAVTVAVPASPTGTFSASPATLPSSGGPVTLTWTSANADSASIAPGIGKVGLQGSTTVNVTSTTTFTLLLSGVTRHSYTATVQVEASSAPDVPVPITPAENALHVPTTATYSWHPSARAESYRLQVSDDSDYVIITSDNLMITDTSYVVPKLGTNRVYYWRVSAQNSKGSSAFSDYVRFTTSDREAPSGSILATPDTLPVGGGLITLQWTSTNADSAVIDHGIGRVPLTGSRAVALSSSQTYTLELFGNGVLNYSVEIVVLNQQQLPVPLPSFPLNGAQNVATTTTLSWHPIAGASRYLLQVADDSLFSHLTLNDSTVTDTSQQIAGLAKNQVYYWHVQGQSVTGASAFSPTMTFSTTTTPVAAVPSSFLLDQNYPNPFNPATTITVHLAMPSHLTLVVYDVLGSVVARLVDGDMAEGSYPFKFDAKNLASGIYICQADIYNPKTGLIHLVSRMLLVK